MSVHSEFLPAIGPYVTEEFSSRATKALWRSPIHWLDKKNTSIYFPQALVSHALWRDSMPFPFEKEGLTLFGDSGGYTVVTQPEYSTSPTDVIRWQLEHCTRGVMLDIPPYRPGSAIQFRGSAAEWWEESITLSRRNVMRAMPLYLAHKNSGGKFKWWGVLQGEERSQIEEWHREICGIYPFVDIGEGWALAPKPSTDLLSCTRYMRFAHDVGIHRVHLLQVTADKVVALVLALANLSGNFQLVTYDSASALRCAINRSLIIPDGEFGQRYIKETRITAVDALCPVCEKIGTECLCLGNENMVHEYLLTCPCQACEGYRKDYPLTNSEYPHYLLLHNHLIMVESFRKIAIECEKNPDKMIRWAAGNKYGAVMSEWEKLNNHSKTQRRTVSLLDRI